MLFNSYAFILLFLPATTAVFNIFRRYGAQRAAFASLALASLAFYAWWSLRDLGLLIGLMAVNFGLARWLIAWRQAPRRWPRLILTAGLVFNLGALGYFKYANFLVATVDHVTGAGLQIASIALPLGISFFTFQKIALLVDCYAGKVERLDLLEYVLFVSFFPQLIAGPIVHHSEVMPQFRARPQVTAETVCQALAIFTVGLSKKVLLADTLAPIASPVFDAAAAGHAIGFAQGWLAALAYALQLYFDFSGYSEMAIGAALLFGVRLPLNFASPYKATSVIDFWRRWHMTLSRFLRDYLYIPLGGNRKGEPRRYLNLFLTMLLGGVWHGAGWTFVLWGALHGIYLTIDHGWRRLFPSVEAWGGAARVGRTVTFFAVVVAWVPFRAKDIGAAARIWQGMIGLTLAANPATVDLGRDIMIVVPLLLLAWLAPNTQQLTGYHPYRTPDSDRSVLLLPIRWRPAQALATGALFACAFLALSKVSEFLYFQF